MRNSFALLVSVFAACSVCANEPDAHLSAGSTAQYSHIAPYQARFGRARPVIAVVGENSGTVLTDFVIPYGILSKSGVADVLAVAPQPGPIHMLPALTILPQTTLASFDERFPEGADYVIVPAVHIGKAESALLGWIQAQAAKGASTVSICDGSLIVAKAGLLKGHRATGHWASQAKREHDFPDTEWLKNTRYVADGKVISSAGITAAIPLSLALVEAIAGTDRAAQVAQDVGVSDWEAQHDSEQFGLHFGTYALAIRNMLSPDRAYGIPVGQGVDEIALALKAEAYSRTYRSHAYSVAESADAIQTRYGLMLIPDRKTTAANAPHQMLPAMTAQSPAQALDEALADIARIYGRSTSNFVALQLEYPTPSQHRDTSLYGQRK